MLCNDESKMSELHHPSMAARFFSTFKTLLKKVTLCLSCQGEISDWCTILQCYHVITQHLDFNPPAVYGRERVNSDALFNPLFSLTRPFIHKFLTRLFKFLWESCYYGNEGTLINLGYEPHSELLLWTTNRDLTNQTEKWYTWLKSV